MRCIIGIDEDENENENGVSLKVKCLWNVFHDAVTVTVTEECITKTTLIVELSRKYCSQYLQHPFRILILCHEDNYYDDSIIVLTT